MVNGRGQMKIQQMAFMIIAIFILFVIIGIAVLSSKLSGIKESATRYNQQNALTLASKIADSPEFSCGQSYGNEKIDCIDLDKVMGLKKNIENYEKFWGVSNIEIRIIYPPENNVVECAPDNYPDCNYIDLIGKGVVGFSVSNFVSVCHKERNENIITNKCDLGKIIISYEVEE
jgi:hypothetical protein